MVLDNPSAGNFEELADLHLQEHNYARARECFDRAISARTDLPDPFYGRALCSLQLGEIQKAIPDLEKVLAKDRKHDYGRAMGLLASAYGQTGQPEAAEKLFRETLTTSTLSETQFRFAEFLAAQGKTSEARDWAQRVASKKATLAGPLRRREIPWIHKSEALLRQLSASRSDIAYFVGRGAHVPRSLYILGSPRRPRRGCGLNPPNSQPQRAPSPAARAINHRPLIVALLICSPPAPMFRTHHMFS
jgi:tetratricopeptide (TPR) repeat protein